MKSKALIGSLLLFGSLTASADLNDPVFRNIVTSGPRTPTNYRLIEKNLDPNEISVELQKGWLNDDIIVSYQGRAIYTYRCADGQAAQDKTWAFVLMARENRAKINLLQEPHALIAGQSCPVYELELGENRETTGNEVTRALARRVDPKRVGLKIEKLQNGWLEKYRVDLTLDKKHSLFHVEGSIDLVRETANKWRHSLFLSESSQSADIFMGDGNSIQVLPVNFAETQRGNAPTPTTHR